MLIYMISNDIYNDLKLYVLFFFKKNLIERVALDTYTILYKIDS